MAKRLDISLSTLAHMERKLAQVEAERAQCRGATEIARLLAALQSPNEHIRAEAVRRVCPCHVPWGVFFQVRKAAQRLQRAPSPLVRASARHVEEDARELAALEALRERLTERAERYPPERRHVASGKRAHT
jgi:hypothetical protein